MSHELECQECEGSGYILDDEGDEIECEECEGTGLVIVEES